MVCEKDGIKLEHFARVLGRRSGTPPAAACPTPTEILTSTSTKLMNMIWLREAVEESLRGAKVTVYMKGRDVFLELDRPVGKVPPWNPPPTPNARRYRLLSWTSKMGCPSFSTPAGHPAIGGTCPGAHQSVVAEDNVLVKIRRRVEAEVGDLRPHAAICEFCYAEAGQYATGQVQFAQLLRLIWVRHALRERTFVPTMVAAIKEADFKLAGGKSDDDDELKGRVTSERLGTPFFRIHDSGDFFSPEYLRAWKDVCRAFDGSRPNLPRIVFWAPTRIWATGWGVAAVNQVNDPPDNFVVRPSAYHINEAPPTNLGPGWSAGSTAIHADLIGAMEPARARRAKLPVVRDAFIDTRYHWNCQAYAGDADHTCREAVAPDGAKGCRACWLAPDDIVNYTLHGTAL